MSAHLPLCLALPSISSHSDCLLQQAKKQLKETSCDSQGNCHFYTKATCGYLSPGLHSKKGTWCVWTPALVQYGDICLFFRKMSKLMQTFIWRSEVFSALLNLSSTVLLINRIMCFRTHMASFCICLVSCTYH